MTATITCAIYRGFISNGSYIGKSPNNEIICFILLITPLGFVMGKSLAHQYS